MFFFLILSVGRAAGFWCKKSNKTDFSQYSACFEYSESPRNCEILVQIFNRFSIQVSGIIQRDEWNDKVKSNSTFFQRWTSFCRFFANSWTVGSNVCSLNNLIFGISNFAWKYERVNFDGPGYKFAQIIVYYLWCLMEPKRKKFHFLVIFFCIAVWRLAKYFLQDLQY